MECSGGNAAMKAADTLRRAHQPGRGQHMIPHSAFAQQAAELAFQEAQQESTVSSPSRWTSARPRSHRHHVPMKASRQHQRFHPEVQQSSSSSSTRSAHAQPDRLEQQQQEEYFDHQQAPFFGQASFRARQQHRTRTFLSRHMALAPQNKAQQQERLREGQGMSQGDNYNPHAWAETLLQAEENSDATAATAERTATAPEDQQQHEQAQQQDLQNAAQEALDARTTIDDDLQQSQFMNLMEQLASGDVSIVDGQLQAGQQQQKREPRPQQQEASRERSGIQVNTEEMDDMMRQFTQAFQHTPADEELSATPEYEFQTEVQPEDRERTADDFVEMGQQALSEGRLTSAIGHFETACQLDPAHTKAWELLGTSRAENEQDDMATAALRTCLDLDPTRQTALLAIATSYANEMQLESAYDALESVVGISPRFSSLSNAASDPRQRQDSVTSDTSTASAILEQRHEQVVNLYLSAIEACGEEINADLQIGLGILQHMKGNFDRAIDCFEVALSVRPDDFQLWNKLGACLANGKRSAEAVDVYRRALELRPGFIRAMYNMGVSCINLKAYEQAAEYFLTALERQSSENQDTTVMSDTIWHSLRMTLMMMERYELAMLTEQRNVALFKGLFRF